MPKYVIRSPRYIDGEYINASPEKPAIIAVSDKVKPDAGMKALGAGERPEPERLRPPHAGTRTGSAPPSHELDHAAVEEAEPTETTAGAKTEKKGGKSVI